MDNEKNQITPNENVSENVSFKYKPVFRIINKKDITKCMSVGVFKEEPNVKLNDEPFHINNNNNIVHSYEYKKYTINAGTFLCNISDTYIQQHNKIPTHYLTYFYNNKFVNGYLFSMFIYFEMTKETIDRLQKNPKEYINSQVNGKYTFEFAFDENVLENFITYKQEEYEKNIMLKYISEFENPLFDQQQLINKIKLEVYNELNKYLLFFKPINITTPIYKKKIFDLFKSKYNNNIIYEILHFTIALREQERIKKFNNNDVYDINK